MPDNSWRRSCSLNLCGQAKPALRFLSGLPRSEESSGGKHFRPCVPRLGAIQQSRAGFEKLIRVGKGEEGDAGIADSVHALMRSAQLHTIVLI